MSSEFETSLIVSRSASVERALHADARPVEHMGIDHRGADVLVAQQLLHGPNLVGGLLHEKNEGVAQRVTRRRLLHYASAHRALSRDLQRALLDMIPTAHAG